MTDATNPAPQPTPPSSGDTTPPAPPAAPGYGGSYAPPAAPQPQYSAPQYPASGYGQAPYGQASYGYAPAAPARPTNVLAIVSLIASIAGLSFVPLLGSIAGAIMGHISLRQVKTSGENGRGLALAGAIVGWVGTGMWVLLIVFWVIWVVFIIGLAASSGPTTIS